MYMNLSIQGNKDKGKDKAIEVSSETNSEATVTVTPPRPKGVVIGSPKWRSSGKAKKSRKKRRRSEYEVTALFRDRKLHEKFDSSWVKKNVANGSYIDCCYFF